MLRHRVRSLFANPGRGRERLGHRSARGPLRLRSRWARWTLGDGHTHLQCGWNLHAAARPFRGASACRGSRTAASPPEFTLRELVRNDLFSDRRVRARAFVIKHPDRGHFRRPSFPILVAAFRGGGYCAPAWMRFSRGRFSVAARRRTPRWRRCSLRPDTRFCSFTTRRDYREGLFRDLACAYRLRNAARDLSAAKLTMVGPSARKSENAEGSDLARGFQIFTSIPCGCPVPRTAPLSRSSSSSGHGTTFFRWRCVLGHPTAKPSC